MASSGSREIVDEWLRTWTYMRGLRTTQVDGWPLVHVRSRTRATELICTDPSLEEFVALMRHVAWVPRAMLTVIAADAGPYRDAPVRPGVRVDRNDETLMSATFGASHVLALGDGFTARWDDSPRRVTYVADYGNTMAAEGTMGVLDAVATFEQIETSPQFRRRGLGRHVMTTLTAQAMERGATRGVLAASAQGRALYTSLGWTPTLEMFSLMGV